VPREQHILIPSGLGSISITLQTSPTQDISSMSYFNLMTQRRLMK